MPTPALSWAFASPPIDFQDHELFLNFPSLLFFFPDPFLDLFEVSFSVIIQINIVYGVSSHDHTNFSWFGLFDCKSESIIACWF